MDRTRQEELVVALGSAVIKGITDHIAQGHIPESWDGFELRQLLADLFADVVVPMDRTRKRAYTRVVEDKELWR